VIKSFARERDVSEKFRNESELYKSKSLQLTQVNALFFPLILSLIGLSIILTVYKGGTEVISGSVTIGNIAEFILYVNLLTWPVTSLGWVSSIIQRAAASQRRINEFLYAENDIHSAKNRRNTIRGAIAFDNVGFVYPDSGIRALHGISFRLEPGETMAIIGTTGSGKSTIANLMCRLYDCSSGTIRIDDIDIRDYNPQHLRSNIGYVPQDVFLFSDTIFNNVAFGFEQADHDQIVSAIANADLLENIESFPKKYHTVLGERGVTLSGGQKQRLSIARAIVRKPSILLLDDCLSAVDTRTENIILGNLQRIMKDCTSIIISHRVSSAKLADKIIVLDDGKIVEQGTNESLMSANGVYRSLYEKQLQAEETPET
jgi:ATP-binding cassette subfamily B protein